MDPRDANETEGGQNGLILIEQILAGNQGLFEELIRAEERVVAGVLRRYLRCQEDIHDAMQTTWIQVWLNLGGFRGQAKFRNWVVRIAINEALTICRRRARAKWVSMDTVLTSGEIVMRTSTEPSTLAPFLHRAMAELPSPYNRALAGYALEGLTDGELAIREAISVAAAKSRVHRARQLMRQSWEARRKVGAPVAGNLPLGGDSQTVLLRRIPGEAPENGSEVRLVGEPGFESHIREIE
jgi:RNA polymerase sigma-70 factor, ECF subfamily